MSAPNPPIWVMAAGAFTIGSIDTDAARRSTRMSRSTPSPPQVNVMAARTSAAVNGARTTA